MVIPESANARIALGILYELSLDPFLPFSFLIDPGALPLDLSPQPLMHRMLVKALLLDVEPSLYLSV